MSIRVWNTLTRRKEDLESLEPPRPRLFVRGPTVYDDAHLGHAKTYTHFEPIARHLRLRGFAIELDRVFGLRLRTPNRQESRT